MQVLSERILHFFIKQQSVEYFSIDNVKSQDLCDGIYQGPTCTHLVSLFFWTHLALDQPLLNKALGVELHLKGTLKSKKTL